MSDKALGWFLLGFVEETGKCFEFSCNFVSVSYASISPKLTRIQVGPLPIPVLTHITHMYVCVCTHAYTYTHTYTHTHTHQATLKIAGELLSLHYYTIGLDLNDHLCWCL